MILQALNDYYERLIEQQAEDVAPIGCSPEKISFEVLLKLDGSVAQINDIRDTSGNVLLEAMASGLPAVILSHQGVAEIATDDTARFLAPSS